MEFSHFDEQQAERFARLALDCVHREYPNKIAHVLRSDADVKPPRELTPAFYGCFDWHSSVHGHWLLVRLMRLFPQSSFTSDARQAVDRSLTVPNIRQEVNYLTGPERNSFERPYGLAWLLQLAAELRDGQDPNFRSWSHTLRPLEEAAIARLSSWLPKLAHPVRTGEHNNTAFAIGMMLDYARSSGKRDFARLLESRARDYYLADRNCPVSFEPSGEDFLSPCLAEADLLRRILPSEEFAPWLDSFLPRIAMEPTAVSDKLDGKLYHLAGLNLSRAWMLEGIASTLPSSDPRRGQLGSLARTLGQAGLAAITAEHYEGGHWLGSFAVYLLSARGLS